MEPSFGPPAKAGGGRENIQEKDFLILSRAIRLEFNNNAKLVNAEKV